jgi:hypothetical protein
VDHHGAVEDGVGDELTGLFDRDPLGLAGFVVGLGVLLELGRGRGIDRGDVRNVHALLLGHRFDLLAVADQDDLGQLLVQDLDGRLDRAGLLAFGQDDLLGIGFGLGFKALEQCHDGYSSTKNDPGIAVRIRSNA